MSQPQENAEKIDFPMLQHDLRLLGAYAAGLIALGALFPPTVRATALAPHGDSRMGGMLVPTAPSACTRPGLPITGEAARRFAAGIAQH